MQIICTRLQTDNNASTSPLSFCNLHALAANQPTSSVIAVSALALLVGHQEEYPACKITE